MCVEVMCLVKFLGFDKVGFFCIYECWDMEFRFFFFGNGVLWKVFTLGNYDFIYVLRKMNLLEEVFGVVGG